MFKFKSTFFIIILLSFTSSFAKQCKIDKSVFYTILMTEGLKNKAGYEYLISFNNQEDSRKLRKNKHLKKLFINNRTIDCENTKLCVYIVKELIKKKIKNYDLGAFQINHKVHNLKPLKRYFDINKSYFYACGILNSCIKKYGFNWEGIACYHSQTPKYNKKYRKKLKENFKKVIDKIRKQK